MVELAVFAAIIVIPVFAALILRVHALYVFVGVCVGYFLQFTLTDDFDLALAMVIRGSDSALIVRLTLLALPLIATLFFMKKTAGKSALFQLVPLVLSGLMLGSIALPLLPEQYQTAVLVSEYGRGIRGAEDLVISGAAVANLTLMWMLFRHTGEHKKHK